MILYNVTVSIDVNTAESWLEWMKEVHIPDVMKTECFIESRISKVVGEEEGGKTYAITYLAPSRAAYNNYQEFHAPKLQEKHTAKFAGKFAAFRTLLEVEEEFKA